MSPNNTIKETLVQYSLSGIQAPKDQQRRPSLLKGVIIKYYYPFGFIEIY